MMSFLQTSNTGIQLKWMERTYTPNNIIKKIFLIQTMISEIKKDALDGNGLEYSIFFFSKIDQWSHITLELKRYSTPNDSS